MCIFSGEVKSVSGTSIFARRLGTRQFLVYEMSIEARQEAAMILPIPVTRVDSFTEHSTGPVRFISLESYPEFFKDMVKPYQEVMRGSTFGGSKSIALEVHKVGCFDASYVPTVNDFDRLDARFRLPAAAARHPAYADYGFVVFQLQAGKHDVHPMAFAFETALSGQLFFPTVHVHDGEHMHEQERFDHNLYAQDAQPITDWEPSKQTAENFMNGRAAKGIVNSDQRCYRRAIHGMQDNADVFCKLA